MKGTSRPLPRAVRGCWYVVADELSGPTSGTGHPMVSFGLDGTYRRYEYDDGQPGCVEEGEYNFDGDFLVLRGRRTETFRVHRTEFWHWDLEGKKESRALVRGFVDGDRRRVLSDEVARDIRMVPLRVRVDTDDDLDETIHRFVYEGGDEGMRRVATFSVERFDDDRLWVGIAPLVRGIDASVWQRLVRESYLDTYRDEPDGIDSVSVVLFDDRTSRQFDYSGA